jgi:formylglycine-generating enzyme required for sulfatase activity
VDKPPDASVETKIALAKKQASIGAALLVMGRNGKVWPLLRHQPDPTMRSFLVERMAPGGVDAKMLYSRLDAEKDVSARRAILLSLGKFGLDRLSLVERQNLLPRLLELYRDDPDPGMHGAAEWLLRQWEMTSQIKEIDKAMATGKVEGKRQWYINRQGQTMMIVAHADEFWMGEGQGRHRQQIGRSFAIASKEVTMEQFLRFRKDHRLHLELATASDCPANYVSWYEAAAYCNWLSEQEGIPKDQWCYEPNQEGKYDEGMRMPANSLVRTGYRLPTEAEWEYACRAGAETLFSFGEAEELVGEYGWFLGNSVGKLQPVGRLRPSDLGLFDVHGNAWEWTQSVYLDVKPKDGKAISDIEDIHSITDAYDRVMRGGSFAAQPVTVRSAHRSRYVPAARSPNVGFRPARTFTAD